MGKTPLDFVLGRLGKDGAKTRRAELRRRIVESGRASLREKLLRPEVITLALVLVAYVIGASLIGEAFRDAVLLSPGRIMDTTRTVRVAFQVQDKEKTERERDRRRWESPRIYALDAGHLEELGVALESLPATLAAAETFEQVAPQIVEQFGLTPPRFIAVSAFAEPGETQQGDAGSTGTWKRCVNALRELLATTPLVSSAEYQLLLQEGQKDLEVVRDGAQPKPVPRSQAINMGSPDQTLPEGTQAALAELVRRAGFGGEGAGAVVARLAWGRKPTCTFDREASARREAEATASVRPVKVAYDAGDIVYRAGEVLTERQRALAIEERDAYAASLQFVFRVVRAAAMVLLVSIVTLAVVGYCRFYYPEHFERWWQSGRLALASLGMVAASCWGAASVPGLVWFMALAPTVLLSLVVLVAYDRRVALLVTGAQATLVAMMLGLEAGFVVVNLAGSMVANWRLSEIRTRTDMVLGGLAMTGILAIGVGVVSLVERPMWPGLMMAGEVVRDSLAAGAGGFVATAIAMVLLPGIERMFGVTTGMTLSELRDPKHPLLRELQQRAPGTYNHSLNVASLAEAGANAIGAQGLHLYVGALYHDVGKMNKPEYFVENQPRGFNRHEKLSPAMSLLVIVGHVKDGVELARAYRLPKSLIHYIESHHGTTLVEYFFDQAKRQAQEGEGERPTEIEYRYPGPRPRTKEAAVLMLCDAVESATRAMADPTPGRIAALVRSISRKRLTDGQFDESGITLRELSQVEEAVTKSLAAVYHGRLAYPKAEPAPEEFEAMAAKADRVAAEQGA